MSDEIDKAGRRNPHRFKPGQSGNPGGRQKGVERMFREMIAQSRCKIKEIVAGVETEIEVDGWEMCRRRLMSIIQYGDDKDANVAIKFAYERAFGQAKQTVALTDDVPEEREIDWDQVPLEEKRTLLAALQRIEALTHPHDGTEH